MSNLSDFVGGGTPPEWVTGTTYAKGKVVLSPVDFCYYVRKVAGAGSTDPSGDTTNWQVTGRAIKSIQRGVITISGGSGTATITSVNTAKSELRYLGMKTNVAADMTLSLMQVVLTNSTTITATTHGVGGSPTVSWELTEYY